MADLSQFDRLDLAIDALLARRDSQPLAVAADLSGLVEIGAALRELPREEYRVRVRRELEDSARAAVVSLSPVRRGFRTMTPYLPVREVARLIEFMREAFGAEEICHFTAPTGSVHAEVRVGGSMVMVGGGAEWKGPPMPTSLWMYVEDADAVYARALRAGAKTINPPADQPYGDREAGVTDFAGNQWFISTHKGPRYVPERLHDLNLYLHPTGAPELAKFVERAFGAEVVERHEAPDGSIAHAKIRIGTSVMGLSEARGEYPNMPTVIYMYVPDVDADYKRAVEAGAEPVSPPADQPYGDRSGIVRDFCGNRWFIASRLRDVEG